jgi:hypothetical protein
MWDNISGALSHSSQLVIPVPSDGVEELVVVRKGMSNEIFGVVVV